MAVSFFFFFVGLIGVSVADVKITAVSDDYARFTYGKRKEFKVRPSYDRRAPGIDDVNTVYSIQLRIGRSFTRFEYEDGSFISKSYVKSDKVIKKSLKDVQKMITSHAQTEDGGYVKLKVDGKRFCLYRDGYSILTGGEQVDAYEYSKLVEKFHKMDSPLAIRTAPANPVKIVLSWDNGKKPITIMPGKEKGLVFVSKNGGSKEKGKMEIMRDGKVDLVSPNFFFTDMLKEESEMNEKGAKIKIVTEDVSHSGYSGSSTSYGRTYIMDKDGYEEKSHEPPLKTPKLHNHYKIEYHLYVCYVYLNELVRCIVEYSHLFIHRGTDTKLKEQTEPRTKWFEYIGKDGYQYFFDKRYKKEDRNGNVKKWTRGDRRMKLTLQEFDKSVREWFEGREEYSSAMLIDEEQLDYGVYDDLYDDSMYDNALLEWEVAKVNLAMAKRMKRLKEMME